MHSVLFICSANICRSPMAMGLLKIKVKDEADDWKIESAGIWAYSGDPAAVNTQIIIKARGGDVSSHRSQPITTSLVEAFNLILVMERGHKEALRAAFPEYAPRIFLMSEMIGESLDIADPVGHPLEDYEHTSREIDLILDQGFEKISQLSKAEAV
ncbi:MAG: hypothetical protein JXB15_12530 [Anaerolineales bacterium]|nr:hypothetical protein [Anaerolineales bacterium]